jgi:hypothetical protein
MTHKKTKISMESFGGTSEEHELPGVYLTPIVTASAFDGAWLQMYLAEE